MFSRRNILLLLSAAGTIVSASAGHGPWSPSRMPWRRDVSQDLTCGGANANSTCPGTLCCSQYGYCGNTTDFCGNGCQATFGTCTPVVPDNSTVIPGDNSTVPGAGDVDMTCGTSNGNRTCPGSLCCSQSGWCGNTTDYCGEGCQTPFGGACLPVTLPINSTTPDNSTVVDPNDVDMTCGASNGNKTCPGSLCCSQYGYCGNTTDYCGEGCQTPFGGACLPVTLPDNSTAPVQTNGTDPGDLELTCGGQHNNTICPNSLCCSAYGFCGNTTDYCGDGCQTGFGFCTSGGLGGGNSSATGTGLPCGANNGGAVCAANECCSIDGVCGTGKDFCEAPDCQFQYGPGCDANKSPAGASTAGIPRTQNGQVLYGGDGIYGCVNNGEVALTFDDGPFIYTEKLLDTLKQYNATATFFITGNNIGKGEIDDPTLPWFNLIKRMYAEGHQLASHTWSHADLCKLTSDQRKAEMIKLEMALRNIVGVVPTYMRPPFSSCSAECGCEGDMSDLGYHVIYFDLDTADYLNDSPTLIQNSKNNFDQGLKDKNNALVIGHDIHQQTVDTLAEYMLQGLASRNLKTVTVGQCLGDPAANWYRQA